MEYIKDCDGPIDESNFARTMQCEQGALCQVINAHTPNDCRRRIEGAICLSRHYNEHNGQHGFGSQLLISDRCVHSL
jgi:hypothetical protein